MSLAKQLEIVQERIELLATRRHEHESWSGVTMRVQAHGRTHFTGIHKEMDELYERKRQLIQEIEDGAYRETLRQRVHPDVAAQYLGSFNWRMIPGLWESALRKVQVNQNGNASSQ